MSEAAESKVFKLSERLSVQITAGIGGLVMEWIPEQPGRLTDEELASYRNARGEMAQQLAKRLGVSVAVIEV